QAVSRRPRRDWHWGRSSEACVSSDRFPLSYLSRLRRKRVFSLHRDAPVVLVEHGLAHARHLLEILGALEGAVRLAPGNDLLRHARAHALELHELVVIRLVEVGVVG